MPMVSGGGEEVVIRMICFFIDIKILAGNPRTFKFFWVTDRSQKINQYCGRFVYLYNGGGGN